MGNGRRRRRLVRLGLAYLALSSGYVALWILLAPRTFYRSFPTGPGEWVSVLPPYNEHLLRDFGAAGLGLAVLALLAAVWMERRLVQATAVAALVSSLPHLAYHLTTTDRLATADNLLSLTGLALPAVVGVGLLVATRRPDGLQPAGTGAGAGSPPPRARPGR